MKRFFTWILGLTSCFALIFIMLFTALNLTFNNDEWFKTEYYRLDVSRKTGVYNSDLLSALDEAREVIKGDLNDSDYFRNAEIGRLNAIGQIRTALFIALAIGIALCALFFIVAPITMRHEWLAIFSKSYITAACIWFLPVAALVIALGANADGFFGWWNWTLGLFGFELARDYMLSFLFPTTLLFDLVMDALKTGLTVVGILLIAAIVYTVVNTRRRRSPIMLKVGDGPRPKKPRP